LDDIELRPSDYCSGDNIKPSTGNIIYLLEILSYCHAACWV